MDLGVSGLVVVVAGGDAATVEACLRTLRAEGAVARSVGLDAAPALADERVDAVVVLADAGPAGRVLDLSAADQLRSALGVVTSAVALYRAVLPGMVQARRGRLVVVTTSAVKALSDDADELAALSGLALLGMHKAAVADVAQHGITANAVLRPADADVEDVAGVVAFLLSDGAGYLQGTTISLDGAGSPVMF